MEQQIHTPNVTRVKRIASHARRWVKATYSKTPNWNAYLGGFCAIAAYRVWKQLKKNGIESVFVVNYWDGHCYVMWNKLIVDIAATQFGDYPEVMIEKPEKLGENWRVGRAARTEWQIANLLKKWGKEQKPFIAESC